MKWRPGLTFSGNWAFKDAWITFSIILACSSWDWEGSEETFDHLSLPHPKGLEGQDKTECLPIARGQGELGFGKKVLLVRVGGPGTGA